MSFLYQILSVFLQLSIVFAADRTPPPYYGPISSSPRQSRHESGNFEVNVVFENFREVEAKSLESEVREVLSQIVPAALAAAIKKEDSGLLFTNIGNEGWNIVQAALVQVSSILYRDDLAFVGGSGGMDLDELWEDTCKNGKSDAAVWYEFKKGGGSKESSNTISICPSFFRKQGIAPVPHGGRIQEYVCKDVEDKKLMTLRSAILLQEFAQTSHVGGGLRPGGSNSPERVKTVHPGGTQEVLQEGDTAKVQLEKVDVELFTLYAILAWRKSMCEKSGEKFDWMKR